jgi:hypothetical protein
MLRQMWQAACETGKVDKHQVSAAQQKLTACTARQHGDWKNQHADQFCCCSTPGQLFIVQVLCICSAWCTCLHVQGMAVALSAVRQAAQLTIS